MMPDEGLSQGREKFVRWPSSPLAWCLLLMLAPVAVLFGCVYGLLAPLLWMVLWLLPF